MCRLFLLFSPSAQLFYARILKQLEHCEPLFRKATMVQRTSEYITAQPIDQQSTWYPRRVTLLAASTQPSLQCLRVSQLNHSINNQISAKKASRYSMWERTLQTYFIGKHLFSVFLVCLTNLNSLAVPYTTSDQTRVFLKSSLYQNECQCRVIWTTVCCWRLGFDAHHDSTSEQRQ